MTQPASQKALQSEASRFAPRLRRAFEKGIAKLRLRLALLKLAEAIAAKNIARAEAAAGVLKAEDELAPLSGFMRDAYEKGGKTGARLV